MILVVYFILFQLHYTEGFAGGNLSGILKKQPFPLSRPVQETQGDLNP